MATDVDKLRQAAESLLKDDKSLNEKDAKAALARMLKVKPAEVGAGVIREVRRKLGIDRPAALAWARALLAKAPTTEARVVIDAVAESFLLDEAGLPVRDAAGTAKVGEGLRSATCRSDRGSGKPSRASSITCCTSVQDEISSSAPETWCASVCPTTCKMCGRSAICR